MRKNNERIAIRLPLEQREKLDQLVLKGDHKTLSQVIRTALKEFLSINHKGENDFASE